MHTSMKEVRGSSFAGSFRPVLLLRVLKKEALVDIKVPRERRLVCERRQRENVGLYEKYRQ